MTKSQNIWIAVDDDYHVIGAFMLKNELLDWLDKAYSVRGIEKWITGPETKLVEFKFVSEFK